MAVGDPGGLFPFGVYSSKATTITALAGTLIDSLPPAARARAARDRSHKELPEGEKRSICSRPRRGTGRKRSFRPGVEVPYGVVPTITPPRPAPT
jgi:hypothetical protein